MTPTAAPTAPSDARDDAVAEGPAAALVDAALPTDDMLGPGAAAVLQAALAPLGATVERTTPTGTTYTHGRALVVQHRTRVRWPDGRATDEDMALATGRRAPEGSLVISDGTHDIVVWRGAADPWLPGYAPALDPAVVGPLLADLDLPATDLRTRVRAYRPGRRAVVEVWGPGVRAFLKVVRPKAAEALHRRHEALAGAAPVPASMGWSAEHGIVVLQALPGRTVRQVLSTTGALPKAGALRALLDALPPSDAEDRGARWRQDEFATHIGTIVPSLADRTAALAAGLAPFEAEARAEAPVPVHGDLYDAQVLVDGGRIVGLLDVDTYGTGRRVDDLATYVGHLVVLATTLPDARQRIEAYARRVLAGFDGQVDPGLLRAGVAGVILGLATGSFRVLEPHWERHTEHRIALAEQWLASAHEARRS